MSVQSKLKAAEIEQKRIAAAKDIEQREKESLRGFIPRFPQAKLSINDPSWYKKFQPVETVISLPNFVSKTVPVKDTIVSESSRLTGNFLATMNYFKSKMPLPSVLVHHYLPHIGKISDFDGITASADDTDKINNSADSYPINTAMLRDLMQLGKFNSRTVIPDPSIMGFYIITVTDLYALATKLRLALSVALHYSSNDISIPRNIIEGLGFDYTEFVNHLKEWRAVLQEMICLINSALPIPSTLTYFSRRIWLAATIVKSTESSLSPIQLFDQFAYARVNDDATELTYADWYNRSANDHPQKTYSKFRDWVKRCVNSLLLNEEICTFISNLRAGIQAEKFYLMDTEIPTEISIPVIDEVRLILQNMIVYPVYDIGVIPMLGGGHWNVKHDVDGNLYQPGALAIEEYYGLSRIQQSFNGFRNLENDSYLVASRLKMSSFIGIDSADDKYTFVKNCGTEVMVGSELFLTGNDLPIPLSSDYYFTKYYNHAKSVIQAYNVTNPEMVLFSDYIAEMDDGFGHYSVLDAILDSYLKCIDGLFIVKKIFEHDVMFREQQVIEYLCVDIREIDFFVPVSHSELNFINDVCLKSLYYLEDNDFRSDF